MASAVVRVYGALNDFLPPTWRQQALVCPLKGPTSIKDLIESLGVPHPEIDLLVVDGKPVDFSYGVRDQDRIAVYPEFCSIDVEGIPRLRPSPQTVPRFVADVHLGRLTAYLRLAGFDTEYRNDYEDREVAAISNGEDRTVLTRDVGILKHRAVSRGYFVRETQPARQFIEVLRQFNLVRRAAPFTLCVRCNAVLHHVPKDRVAHLLQPRTREQYRDFSTCPACERIYWRGTHYLRMTEFLEMAFAAAT